MTPVTFTKAYTPAAERGSSGQSQQSGKTTFAALLSADARAGDGMTTRSAAAGSSVNAGQEKSQNAPGAGKAKSVETNPASESAAGKTGASDRADAAEPERDEEKDEGTAKQLGAEYGVMAAIVGSVQSSLTGETLTAESPDLSETAPQAGGQNSALSAVSAGAAGTAGWSADQAVAAADTEVMSTLSADGSSADAADAAAGVQGRGGTASILQPSGLAQQSRDKAPAVQETSAGRAEPSVSWKEEAEASPAEADMADLARNSGGAENSAAVAVDATEQMTDVTDKAVSTASENDEAEASGSRSTGTKMNSSASQAAAAVQNSEMVTNAGSNVKVSPAAGTAAQESVPLENVSLDTSEFTLAKDLTGFLSSRVPLQNRTQFSIELEPHSLGKILIQVSTAEGRTALSIAASNPDTLRLLSQSAGEMASILQRHTGQQTEIVLTQQPAQTGAQTADSESSNKQTAQEQREQQLREQRTQADSQDTFLHMMRLGLA